MFPTNIYRTDSNLIILGASVRELYINSSKNAGYTILRAPTAHQTSNLHALGGTLLFFLYTPV